MNGYAILRKLHSSPPTNFRLLTSIPEDLDKYGGICALDIETHGLDPILGSIRSVAITNDYGTVAIDLEALSTQDRFTLTKWIMKQRLVAHNAVFDCGWLYTKTGQMPNIHACTLVLFKLLATEGWDQQRWGLKTAMTDILGWRETNEADLDNWLKDNKLKKSDMAKAPWEILGKYNAMDTAATWQLYKHFMATIEEHGWQENVMAFQSEDFVNLMELLIEQQFKGLTIDMENHFKFDKKIETQIQNKKSQFLSHPKVKSHVEYYQQVLVEELVKTLPEQYTKTGKVAANYTKKIEKIEATKQRLDFNIDSGKQLQWLMYDRLFFECPLKTPGGAVVVGKKAFTYWGELGIIMKEYRELRDRRKFVTSLGEVQIDGVLHPKIKAHATITGRSGGGAG
jgi:DNA polymerase I-like protein with 3'-5' exonuclease and polymerase domains